MSLNIILIDKKNRQYINTIYYIRCDIHLIIIIKLFYKCKSCIKFINMQVDFKS